MGHYASCSLEIPGLYLSRPLLPDSSSPGCSQASHVLLGAWQKKPISDQTEAATLLAWMVVRENLMARHLPTSNLPTTAQDQSCSGANAPGTSSHLCTYEEIPTELPCRSQWLDWYSICTRRSGGLFYHKVMSSLLWLGIRGQIGKRWQNRGHSPYRHGKLKINSLLSQRESDSWIVEGKHQYWETLSLPSNSNSKGRWKPASPREVLSRWQELLRPPPAESHTMDESRQD